MRSLTHLRVNFTLTLAAPLAFAGGIPQTGALSYSGTVAEGGVLVEGTRSIEVKLWSAASGGSELCTTGAANVAVTRGRFRVTLPDACAAAVAGHPDRWVEVLVGGVSHGRAKLGAVPYAVQADNAQKLGGAPATDYLKTTGGTMSGPLSMGGNQVTDVAAPAAASDAANKAYVDSAVSGVTASQWTSSGANIYYAGGNVGVGTAAPTEKFHVEGNIKTKGAFQAGPYCISGMGPGSYYNTGTITFPEPFGSPPIVVASLTPASHLSRLYVSGIESVTATQIGNIQISASGSDGGYVNCVKINIIAIGN